MTLHNVKRKPVSLCGEAQCPRPCTRVCHCEAGLRLTRRLLAQQAIRRFTVKANRQQVQLVLDALVRREIEANIEKHAPPQDLPKFSEQLKWERELYSRNAPSSLPAKHRNFELGVDYGS